MTPHNKAICLHRDRVHDVLYTPATQFAVCPRSTAAIGMTTLQPTSSCMQLCSLHHPRLAAVPATMGEAATESRPSLSMLRMIVRTVRDVWTTKGVDVIINRL